MNPTEQIDVSDEEILNAYHRSYDDDSLLPSYDKAGVNFYHIRSRFAKNFRLLNGLKAVYRLGKSHGK